jgi:hypothetical protein
MAEKNVPGGFLGAGGLQIPPVIPGTESLAATYAIGAAPIDQTLVLTDARGGTVVLNGAGLTGAYPYTLSVLGNQFLGQSMAVGVNVGVVPTARIHVAGGSLNASSASLKLDQGFLMTVAEPGAIESDGANLWWTDGTSTRRKLSVQTLADAYAMGTGATAQTLILTNATGGAFVINGTTPGPLFTGVTAFEVNVNAGSTNFYTKGGFDVSSVIPVVAAIGVNWDSVHFLASTLTLTGGPATVTKVAMVHVGAAVVNGVGNTVSDSYNLLIDAAPAGTATLTRVWGLGSVSAIQAQAGLVLGTGLTAPGENDLVLGTGAVNLSVANSGRLGYIAGATQQFMVSVNGGVYVPLLVGPAASGFTAGSVPFGSATGTLTQDNANFAWLAASKRLTVNGIVGSVAFNVTSGYVNYSGSKLSGSFYTYQSFGSWDAFGADSASGTRIAIGGFRAAQWAGMTFHTSGSVAMSIDAAQNIGIGVTAAATSRLHVLASQSVVSAAGAVWDGVNFAASTLTLTGATTPITTLNFVTIAAPTITAASAVVTTDFYTCRIGAATFAGAGPASATRNWSLGVDGDAQCLGNIVMGTGISAGANAVRTIALHNGATAPAASVDLAHLYCADIAAGRATLAIFTEEAVAADVGLASTHSHIIFINGVKYKQMLVAA